MLFLLSHLVRMLVRLLGARGTDDGSKDLEILVLRHQLQRGRRVQSPADPRPRDARHGPPLRQPDPGRLIVSSSRPALPNRNARPSGRNAGAGYQESPHSIVRPALPLSIPGPMYRAPMSAPD